MKIAEIRELTLDELKERLAVERKNLDDLRINHAVSPLDSPAKLRDSRRLVARLATVLRQREAENN